LFSSGSLNWVGNSGFSELYSTPPYRDRPSETEGKTRRNSPYERRAGIKLLFHAPGHNIHTHHRKMLNVGASSPLNLRRKALQAKLNPSASNSSRSVTGHPSFSSNKSATSDDRGATDLGGGNNHHPHSIPQNSSLVSFRTEEASSSRDGHDRDQDPPTVLNIRFASGGIYGSEGGRSRGCSDQQIAKTYPDVAFHSEEGNTRSSAPSRTVCNPTFRLGDLSLNATPDICFTVSLTVVIEDATGSYRKRACHDHTELGGRVAHPPKIIFICISFHPPVGLFCRNGFGLTLVDTVTMDKSRQPACPKSCDAPAYSDILAGTSRPIARPAGRKPPGEPIGIPHS